MIAASLIATIAKKDMTVESAIDLEDGPDPQSGIAAEAEQYLNGQCQKSATLWRSSPLQANTRPSSS